MPLVSLPRIRKNSRHYPKISAGYDPSGIRQRDKKVSVGKIVGKQKNQNIFFNEINVILRFRYVVPRSGMEP